MEKDKKQHIAVWAGLSAGFFALFAWLGANPVLAVLLSAGVSMGLGVGKEIWDTIKKNKTGFSKEDLEADAIGVTLASCQSSRR